MEWLVSNWQVVVGAVAILVAFGIYLYNANMETLKNWLVYAVTQAESYYGSSTGELKLLEVYDWFVERYSWLSVIISFDTFSNLVDTALEQMQELLDGNEAIATLVAETEETEE